MTTNNLSLYPVVLGAGAVGAPSLYLSTYSTTGLYSPAANQIGITISGTQRALFTSAGLSLTAGTAAAPASTHGDSGTGRYRPAANQLGWSVSGVACMLLSSSGLDLTCGRHTITNSGSQALFRATTYRDSASLSRIELQSSRGTSGTPANLDTNDEVASMVVRAWGTGTTFTQCGLFRFMATEDHSSTAFGTKFQIYVTANTAASVSLGLEIDQDRTMTIPGPLKHTGSTFGVLGATGTTQQTLTGDISTYNETHYKSLLTALAGYGIIVDSTTT